MQGKPRPFGINLETFLSRIDKSGDHWLWTGPTSKHGGYGSVSHRRPDGRWSGTGAHRVSYEIHIGPIPDGLDVLHHCDIPPCVKPECLFLGTDMENRADCVAKRRHAYGERNAFAKLTNADVPRVRSLIHNGRSQRSVGREYGVSHTTIQALLKGKTWTHVT